jgi:hypothetical protein
MIETLKMTEHAIERGKERLGLNERALHRLARRVLASGLRAAEVTGRARRMLDAMGIAHHTTPVVYGEHVFVFAETTLVTVIHVPPKFRAAFRKAAS